MAKCRFPVSLVRSYYRTGNSTGCTATGRFEITFQGRRIMVCKVHRQYDGRDNLY